MKLLLVGHTCSPLRGTEFGITWNWAWHLSAFHEVWVLTHPQYRKEAEDFLKSHPNPRLHLVWVALPRLYDPWKPSNGSRFLHLHYLLWQRAALTRASQLHQRYAFDLIHHVSWGTVSAPPQLWRLPVPF